MAGPLLAGAAMLGLMGSGGTAAEKTDLAGTWTWTWKDPKGDTHQHVLEVEGEGAKLAARERFDDEGPVRVMNLSLTGGKVRFAVVRGDHRAEYKGTIKGDAIDGTVTTTDQGQSQEWLWKAQRRTPPK